MEVLNRQKVLCMRVIGGGGRECGRRGIAGLSTWRVLGRRGEQECDVGYAQEAGSQLCVGGRSCREQIMDSED